MRRRRAKVFGDASLFGEPAYDILLDLYIAHHQDRTVSISNACIAADAPTSTALRHIVMLEKRGLVRRFADCRDGRVSNLILEPSALSALDQLLE